MKMRFMSITVYIRGDYASITWRKGSDAQTSYITGNAARDLVKANKWEPMGTDGTTWGTTMVLMEG